MATVQSMTLDRLLQLEGDTVIGGHVDVAGHLILEQHDNTTIDAGSVIGPTGPTGALVMFAGSTAPAEWLLCDGSAVSRTTYNSLFSVIGTAYGAGDGTTTFNLPNLKGKVPVGLDSAQTEFDTLGESGGAKTHTLTSSEMPSHTHVQNAHTHVQNAHTHVQNAHTHVQNPHIHSIEGGWGAGPANAGKWRVDSSSPSVAWNELQATAVNQNTTPTNQNTTATNQNATATNQNTGGGGSHNNLQPYLVINYIIKT